MAMAGQGLHAAPPPRPASHNFFGQNNPHNPGNQLYVGNVRHRFCIPCMQFQNTNHLDPHYHHLRILSNHTITLNYFLIPVTSLRF